MPDAETLLETARRAYEQAHVPYSEYPVGAALETTDGTVYTGCNVENANYSNSLHAEELALGTAVSDGYTSFETIAVASGAEDNVTPCGMCRQTLAEFCGPEFVVLCGTENTDRYTLETLLPETITKAHLDAARDS